MDDVTLLDDVRQAASAYHAATAEAERLRAELYRRIRLAHEEGIPAARIARSAGLSRERVRQVVSDEGNAG